MKHSVRRLLNKNKYQKSFINLVQFFALLLVSAHLFAAQSFDLKIKIDGVSGDIEENIEAFLTLYQLEDSVDANELTERKIRDAYRKSRQEIEAALQPFGYYAPQITKSLEFKKKKATAQFTIAPGTQTQLRLVNVSATGAGAEISELKALVDSPTLKSGAPLIHSTYKSYKDDLFNAAYYKSYLDATFTKSVVKVNPNKHLADIELKIDTGEKYYFGDIAIEQDILDPDYISKFISVEKDQPFDAQKLIDIQVGLNDTNYFDRVQVEADKDNAVDNHIPVTVKTEPNEPIKYTLGLGYGTDTGARTNLGVELRRVNRRGHRWENNLLLSEVNQRVVSNYHIPFNNVLTDRITITGSGEREKVDEQENKQYLLGISANEQWYRSRRRLFLNLQQSTFRFDDDDRFETTVLLTPGFELTYQNLDDQIYIRQGFKVSGNVRGGYEDALSEVSFARLRISGGYVFSLSSKWRTIIRGEAGLTETDNFAELPPTQRFFAGGDRSIRGYRYKSVSPRTDQNNVRGGKFLKTASIETNYLFYKNWGAALFYDRGGVADVWNDMESVAGAGIGIRYKSPVGVIRVDIARPLDDIGVKSEDEKNVRFHLSIGPDL